MTMTELKQLWHLNDEIAQLEERKAELILAATKSTQTISGLPHISGISDNTSIGGDIVKIVSIIDRRIEGTIKQYAHLMEYIESIPDSFMRQVFERRYIDRWTWIKIAKNTSGDYTADSIRMSHIRYLNKN